MDERTPGVSGAKTGPGYSDSESGGDPRTSDAEPDAEKKAQALEAEINAIRTRLDGLLGELDRRRHEAFDWRLQLQRHLGPVLVGTFCLAAIVGGGIAFRAHRRRQGRQLAVRLGRLKEAASRILAHPSRVAPPESTLPGKFLGTLATALVTTLVRRSVRRALAARDRARSNGSAGLTEHAGTIAVH